MRKHLVVALALLAVAALSIISVPSATAGQPKLIIGSEDGFGAQLYGFARLDIIYNTSRFDHAQFPNYVKLVQSGGEKDDEINIHPRLSRLGVKAWSPTFLDSIKVGGKIELDFQNGGSESRQAVRMRHGYADFRMTNGFYLLAGQTWDLISQLYPMANADSMMWNTGNTGDRAPQLRIGYGVDVGKGKVDVAVAITMPNVIDGRDLDANGTPDGRDAAVPGVQGRVGYKGGIWTKRPFQLAVGALFGKSEATLAGTKQDWTSWGVFVELDLPFHDMVGIRGEWFTGQDLAEVRGGIKQGLTLLTDTGGATTGAKEVSTMGFWAEVYAHPTSYLSLAAGYGQDNPEDDDIDAGGRSMNSAVWGAIHWKIVPPFRVGAEYLFWTTDYKGANETTAHRLDFHFAYIF